MGQSNKCSQSPVSGIPRLPDKVRVFYSFATSRAQQLEQALVNQANQFQQLVKYYAIADCSTPELVYSLLADLVDAFKQADAQLIVQRENEERRKRMNEANEAMKAKSKANTRASTPTRQSSLNHMCSRSMQHLQPAYSNLSLRRHLQSHFPRLLNHSVSVLATILLMLLSHPQQTLRPLKPARLLNLFRSLYLRNL
jgi:hypothetical protein